MAASRQTIAYPQGADLAVLKKFEKKLGAKRILAAKAEHAGFERQVKQGHAASLALGKALGLDSKRVERQLHGIRLAHRSALAKIKPPPIKPLVAHNPTRYAPFDMAWSTASGGGIVSASPYGPTASTGRTGYSIAVFNGGDYSMVSSAGFWYYAGSSGSLHVILEADVWGRALVYSVLFGYAAAYAGLRVFVERYSADFRSWNATSTIYNNNGVVQFDVREFNWERRSVSITVPVRAGTWYAIWGDAVQSAGAGGIADAVSNFQMNMGPVTYWVD